MLAVALLAAIGSARAGGVIYVDREANGFDNGTSWADAFEDLQDALAAASSGDELWVAEGNYYPTAGADRAVSFQLTEGVALYGGFDGTEAARDEREPAVHTTTLSGDIGLQMEESDNSHHVVVGANGATLDGFTLAWGNADGTPAPTMRAAASTSRARRPGSSTARSGRTGRRAAAPRASRRRPTPSSSTAISATTWRPTARASTASRHR